MKLALYIGRRILLLIPQLWGIVTVTFLLIRLLPGNPVHLMAGPLATPRQIQSLTERLGLDQPIHVQYWLFLKGLIQGDLGTSWYSSAPVLSDIVNRFPATLELITFSLILALAIGIPAGVLLAIRPGGMADRASFVYGLFAGALPEFWWALMLIFLFYFKAHVFPAPLGRIGLAVSAPEAVTGMYVIDSLLRGNWSALGSATGHLLLPIFTLTFITCGPILKMTRQTMVRILNSPFVRYAKACGLPDKKISRRALRNALPPVVTLVGIIYGYLIGGAVLVEVVFSWGGMGQYAVQSIINLDYAAVQGVVLFASMFSLLVYLAVDILYFVIDPRITG